LINNKTSGLADCDTFFTQVYLLIKEGSRVGTASFVITG